MKKKSSSKRKKKNKKRGIPGIFITVLAFLLLLGAGLFFVINNKDNKSSENLSGFISRKIATLDSYKDSLTAQTWEAVLYFGDEDSDFLVKEYRKIQSPDDSEKKASIIINELIKGPRAKGIQTIPEQTKLRHISIDAYGFVKIDFSNDLIKRHPGGSSSEMMTVYSIVNTLAANIKEAKKLKILVEGKEIDTIAGHIDCREAMSPRPSLVH